MVHAPLEKERSSCSWPIKGLVLIVFTALLVSTAWLCDDAYISLRVVDNFVSGRGLRWNPDERVQVYTHPLWILYLSPFYAITREAFLTTICLSLATSLTVFALCLARLTRTAPAALFALLGLGSSKAFVDYSTSGLENPLLHALLVAFCLECFCPRSGPTKVERLAFLVSAIGCTRLDALLLVVPTLLLRTWCDGRPALVAVIRGLLPLLAWELFALVYYGSLVPNTALAKLANAVPRGELCRQGMAYLSDALSRDPITMASILAALVLGRSRGMERCGTLLMGVAAYMAYIVSIGGDYMSGRFLSAPFVVCFCLLLRRIARTGLALQHLALVWPLALAAASDRLTWTSAWTYRERSAAITNMDGISDERRYYYPHSNALLAMRGHTMPSDAGVFKGQRISRSKERYHVVLSSGFAGYWAGPRRHLLDRYALCDAFLARLPPLYVARWRPGHFMRALPPEYLESLKRGQSSFKDPELAACYAEVQCIARGPLWASDRWRAIWHQRLGLRVLGASQEHVRYAELRSQTCDFNEMEPLKVKPKLGNRGLNLRWRRGSLPGSGLLLELHGSGQVTLQWLCGEQVLASVHWHADKGVSQIPLPPPEREAAACDGLRLLPRTPGAVLRLLRLRVADKLPMLPLKPGLQASPK